jgi:UDP-glucose 6-dehydrogenase
MICKSLGIDDTQVGLGVSLDRRIGKYGTEGGRPFGGACLPKDIEALVSFASRLNVKPDLLNTTIEVNRQIEELSSAKQLIRDNKQ